MAVVPINSLLLFAGDSSVPDALCRQPGWLHGAPSSSQFALPYMMASSRQSLKWLKWSISHAHAHKLSLNSTIHKPAAYNTLHHRCTCADHGQANQHGAAHLAANSCVHVHDWSKRQKARLPRSAIEVEQQRHADTPDRNSSLFAHHPIRCRGGELMFQPRHMPCTPMILNQPTHAWPAR
jgi:hypothetical protein